MCVPSKTLCPVKILFFGHFSFNKAYGILLHISHFKSIKTFASEILACKSILFSLLEQPAPELSDRYRLAFERILAPVQRALEVKHKCFLFERLFKVKKSSVFLFGISFFVLEIFAFLYYANEESDDVIDRSTKTTHGRVKY